MNSLFSSKPILEEDYPPLEGVVGGRKTVSILPKRSLRFTIVILHFAFYTFSFSQSVHRDEWLKQLTDSSFHGRGYVNNGVNVAGDYLEQEFKKLGAQPVNKKYRQYYSFPVNTFPDSMRVTVNGKNLIPGADYIVDANSGSCNKKFDSIIYLDSNLTLTNEIRDKITSQNYIVIVDIHELDLKNKSHLEKYRNAETVIDEIAQLCPVIKLVGFKLTWSVRRDAYRFPIVECSYSSWPQDEIKEISLNVKNKLIENFSCSNVFAMVKAKKKWKKKKYLVFSAHYDHLGRMGDKTYIPGANDNASGTTMLLCLAEYYAKNPPKDFNVVFIAFSGEEAGLLGSEYFTEHPMIPLKKIAFVMNMDIMGTGDEGITVVNATKHTTEFELLEKINSEHNYLVKVKKRGETANSDHYHFDKKGVKAFFIYTMGGIQAYHDIYDKYETLPLTKFEDLHKMLIEFGERVNK